MILTKMHECGNDCIMVIYDKNVNYSSLAKKVLDRRIGIGADALIVVKTKPLEMLPYNVNGKVLSNYHEGFRCFAKYCYDRNIVKTKFDFIMGFNKIKIEIINDSPFRCVIDCGQPQFKNNMLYISDIINSFGRVIKVNDALITTYTINVNGVNTIVFVDDFKNNILNYANDISNHKLFNRKTNVTFVKVIDKGRIRIKTYDNIRGWVLNNDAAVAASVVCACEAKMVKNFVDVEVEYGTLTVEYKKNIKVYGTATYVIECDYKEE